MLCEVVADAETGVELAVRRVKDVGVEVEQGVAGATALCTAELVNDGPRGLRLMVANRVLSTPKCAAADGALAFCFQSSDVRDVQLPAQAAKVPGKG